MGSSVLVDVLVDVKVVEGDWVWVSVWMVGVSEDGDGMGYWKEDKTFGGLGLSWEPARAESVILIRLLAVLLLLPSDSDDLFGK